MRMLRLSVVLRMVCAVLFSGYACNFDSVYPQANLAPLDQTPRFAVVTTDYVTTAIALLDAQGELITEAWIDSGTRPAGITTTLGGDVVLPSSPPADGTLTVIDRLGIDVVTRIAVPSGDVLQQLHAQSSDTDETGFRANPQDWVVLDAQNALISRHEPNLNASATELDQGNDVLWMNLASGSATIRLDFTSLGTEINGTTIYARPSQMQQRGPIVAVGLARLSLDFRTAGPGAIGLLDIRTRGLTQFDLPQLSNCGVLAAVPNSAVGVWVLCAGETFEETEQRRVGAGVVRLEVAASGIAVPSARWLAVEHGNVLPPSTGLIALDEHRVVVVATGDNQPDQLVVIDTATNTAQVLFVATDSFVLGQGSYSAESKMLLVPDALYGLRRWSVTETGEITPLPTVVVSPLRRLPAREVRALFTTAGS